MRGLKILAIAFLAGFELFAQDEAIVIEESASFIMDGDIRFVLNDISLTNEGNLDATEGAILFSSGTQTRIFSTSSELTVDSLAALDDNVDLTVGGTLEVSGFRTGSTDQITFSDTSNLTVTGYFDVLGSLVMESGSSLWIKGTAEEISISSLDDVTIERIGPHDNSTGKYSVYGSPVNDADFSIFGSKAQDWIYAHNESTKDFSTPSESTMTAGKGYFVAFPGNSEGKVSFNGSPNYKNFTYSLTRTNSGLSDERGFNLIANPFTCPVDFETFIEEYDDGTLLEEATIWIWDDFTSDTGGSTTDDYLAINYLGSSSYDITDSRNGGSANWDGTINVAQGFFVKAVTSGDITFKQNMKTIDGNDDVSFYRVQPTSKYWLAISDDGLEGASTLLGFVDNATYAKDILYDASRLGSGLALYSVLDETELAIQGLPADWLGGYDSDYQIAIGYEVAEAGRYTISLASTEENHLEALYLNDEVNLTSVDLLSDSYEFSTVAGSINDRFTLSLEPSSFDEVLSNEPTLTDIVVYATSNAIVLDADFEGKVSVFTLGGRSVYDKGFTSGKTEISVPYGLYIVSVVSHQGVAAYKISVDY